MSYCPACLDKWTISVSGLAEKERLFVLPRFQIHVRCGQALNAIRRSPRKPY